MPPIQVLRSNFNSNTVFVKELKASSYKIQASGYRVQVAGFPAGGGPAFGGILKPET